MPARCVSSCRMVDARPAMLSILVWWSRFRSSASSMILARLPNTPRSHTDLDAVWNFLIYHGHSCSEPGLSGAPRANAYNTSQKLRVSVW